MGIFLAQETFRNKFSTVIQFIIPITENTQIASSVQRQQKRICYCYEVLIFLVSCLGKG